MSEFDTYARDYDSALSRGLVLSGEDKTYFAEQRIVWLSQCLKQLKITPKSVLDYGCGTGTATPYLIDILGAERVVGVDVSSETLRVAQQTNADLPVEFALIDDYTPHGAMDLVYCNGVFHHIPLEQRDEAIRYIANSLRPGGLLAMWENNPWSPAARYVMSRIAFDRDAVMVWPRDARKLATAAGLSVIRTDYAFVFPRSLRPLRMIEPLVRRLPLGAQYQVLARKLNPTRLTGRPES